MFAQSKLLFVQKRKLFYNTRKPLSLYMVASFFFDFMILSHNLYNFEKKRLLCFRIPSYIHQAFVIFKKFLELDDRKVFILYVVFLNMDGHILNICITDQP